MRALISSQTGGPDDLVIEDMPDPVAGPGQVVLDIKACAINFPDLLIIEDKYQFRPQRPFAPGGEVAGVVRSVGAGVTRWQPGDRVIGVTLHGGLAEQVAVDARRIFPLPARHGFNEGAALLYAYGTALHGLKGRGRLQSGDRLLVLGAAGGVGLAAVELGKALDAHVVAAVSSEEKADVALRGGADQALVCDRGPFDREMMRELSGRFKEMGGTAGFDVIFDTVGGDYAEPALRSIAWGGRYLVIGFPAGISRIPLNLPLLKGSDICGVFWGAFAERDPDACARDVTTLFNLWADGKIAPRATHVFPLEQGGKAIARLASRDAIGKMVVAVEQ